MSEPELVPLTDRPIIVWLTRDLRVTDHPALAAAGETGRPVIPLFVLDDDAPGAWRRGGASRWWLHHSLARLAESLQRLGAPLVLRRGDSCDEIAAVARETKADAVYCSRAYEPWARRLEAVLKERLGGDGVELRRFAGHLLVEPDRVETKTGGPYKVYTPFWRAVSVLTMRTPLPAPDKLRGPENVLAGMALDELGLLPRRPNWATGFEPVWQPGEAGARARLAEFLEKAVARYHDERNRPDRPSTSRLSPHLAFGEITPAECWRAASMLAERVPRAAEGAGVFMKEVVWREFSYYLLFHFPSLPEEPFRPEFERFPWAPAKGALEAWQRGRTGYPIVDAGLRELWQTGWMHNRVRMITASFLIKDLLVPWQDGEAWFWDTLVDADLASNAASWQWVAGSGADAAPYFRIFNPITQGEKFDPDGAYVRRYVPELARLPTEHIHAPWLAPQPVLAAAGVRIGETYPAPIVDHATARTYALAAYAAIKAT